ATIMTRIQQARDHLRNYPSSCSARANREAAFTELSDLGEDDAQYREDEDYIFAPLEYAQSKTCCWNGSTSAMAEIILDYAAAELDQNRAEGVCRPPTAFRSMTDGYARWKAHATAIGRGSEWAEWSEGEPCSQRNVAEDTLAEFAAAPFCEAEA